MNNPPIFLGREVLDAVLKRDTVDEFENKLKATGCYGKIKQKSTGKISAEKFVPSLAPVPINHRAGKFIPFSKIIKNMPQRVMTGVKKDSGEVQPKSQSVRKPKGTKSDSSEMPNTDISEIPKSGGSEILKFIFSNMPKSYVTEKPKSARLRKPKSVRIAKRKNTSSEEPGDSGNTKAIDKEIEHIPQLSEMEMLKSLRTWKPPTFEEEEEDLPPPRDPLEVMRELRAMRLMRNPEFAGIPIFQYRDEIPNFEEQLIEYGILF